MNLEQRLRSTLRDDNLALPAWPDPVARVSAGIERRQSWQRWLGLFTTALVTVLAAFAVRLVVLAPTSDQHTGAWTQLILSAVENDADVPDPVVLDDLGQIIGARAAALGLKGTNVRTYEHGAILVQVPGVQDDATMRALGAVGALRLRKVIDFAEPVPISPPSTTPSGPVWPQPSLASVVAKLGAAYPAALSLKPIDAWQPSEQLLKTLGPFAALTPTEVAVLPVQIQLLVPTITCSQLAARPIAATINPTDSVVACDRGVTGSQAGTWTGARKFLLDVAKVVTTDVKSTAVRRDPSSQWWDLNLVFTPTGQTRWAELTREATTNEGESCHERGYVTGPHCMVAFVIDNDVISAPTILAVLTGNAPITAGSQREAQLIAAEIGSGELPVPVRILDISLARTAPGQDPRQTPAAPELELPPPPSLQTELTPQIVLS